MTTQAETAWTPVSPEARLWQRRHSHRRQCFGYRDGAAAMVVTTRARAGDGLRVLGRLTAKAVGVTP